MRSNVERLAKNHVSVEIGLDPAEVDQALDKAYLKVVRKVKVPGFRQGKVPRPILEAQYGKEILYEDAAEIMIPDAYRRAIDEHKLEPIDQPELTVVEPLIQGKPFVFKATVPVLPEVILGKYTGIKAEKPARTVSDEEVTSRLEAMREQYAELVLSEHDALENGDYAVVDFDGFMDGAPFRGGSATGYTIEIGGGGYLPGFAEGMLGMRPEETREVKVQFPEDYHAKDLAGKEAVFRVVLREIKRKELPALDEDFAKSLGHDSVEALTASVRSSLQAAADREGERTFSERVLEQVVAEAKVEIPEVLIARQVEHRLESLKRNVEYQGMKYDQYLADLGKNEDELKDDARPQAEEEVRRELVLDAIRKAESIQPTEEEIQKRVEELATISRVKDAGGFRRALERSGRLSAIVENLAREKTIKFLVEKAEPLPERKDKKG
ncbi:MAG: trigger factor [Bacteroidota bacterium]